MTNEIEVRTASGKMTSLQVVQDIYNNITGKTETSSRLFFDAHIVSLNDLESLHTLIEQSIEQYNCVVSNCSIGVRLCDGKSENFSGFSKFKIQGTNRSRPTVEVELEYDFLILLPKTDEAKPYKLVVGLRSGMGIIESFNHTNATETEKSMYFQLQSGTARLEIHYVDLAVARSLEAAVEDWYRGLSKVPFNKLMSIVKDYSRWIPSIIRSLVVSSVLWLTYLMHYGSVTTSADLFRAILISGAVSGVAVSFSIPISSYATRLIDRSRPASAITLSKADTELYEVSKKNPRSAFFKASASALAAIVLGLIAAYIGGKIGIS